MTLQLDPSFTKAIIDSLANSINPDKDARTQAEQTLKMAQKTKGYASALLRIAGDNSLKGQYQIDINHAASIQFGSLVEKNWKFMTVEQAEKIVSQDYEYILLDEEDKQCVRENIMAAIFEQVQNKLIQKQFIRSLKMICTHDFPQKLPNLFPQIMNYLTQQNQLAVYAGLLGLLALTSRYEFELDQEREPLQEIVQQSFSALGGLVNDIASNLTNDDALYMLNLICKIFYVSNQLSMSRYLLNQANIEPWILLFKTILNMDHRPEYCIPTSNTLDIEARNKLIFWKIKGKVAKCTYRMFIKYGNPKIVEEKEEIVNFSNSFWEKYSILLFECHLKSFFAKKDQFVGTKTLSFAIKFIGAATKVFNTMEYLKPYVKTILQDYIVPIMYVTEQDQQSFHNEPVEFIRNQYDFTDTLYQPKTVVLDLLTYLCKYSSELETARKNKKKKNKKKYKPDYLQGFLEYAYQNLAQYDEQVKIGNTPDWRIKEALMYTLGSLSEEILSQKEIKAQLPTLLQTFVMPELTSSEPFLRLRASQTYGVYSDSIKYDDQHLKTVVAGLSSNMTQNQPLPLKFYAACALEKMLRVQVARDMVKQNLDGMLKCYLSLMSEVDNEELVSSFEYVMGYYQDQMGPFAEDVCLHLKNQYIRLVGQDPDEDDGESILAAVASFTSIGRIIDAVQDNEVLLNKIENIVYPCLLHSLTADGLDSIEEGIDCITMLLHHGYKSKPISVQLWKLFPRLLFVCAGEDGDTDGGFGFEFVGQIITALKNYFARDPQGCLSIGPDQEKSYLQLTFHFISRVLAVNRNSQGGLDGVAIMNFIIAILENLAGQIDQQFQVIAKFVIDELDHVNSLAKKPKEYNQMILQTISALFFYNARLTFQYSEQNGKTFAIFQGLFLSMNDFKKDFEIRRIIMGLTAILRIPVAQLPQMVAAKSDEVCYQLSLLCKKMNHERQEAIKENDEYIQNGGSDDDDDDSDVSDLDDENDMDAADGIVDEDSEEEFKKTNKILQKVGAKLQSGKPLTAEEMKEMELEGDGSNEDDEDSEYDYFAGNDDRYDSRLDDFDELKFVKETLQEMSQLDMQNLETVMRLINNQSDHKHQFEQILINLDQMIIKEAEQKEQIKQLDLKKKEVQN